MRGFFAEPVFGTAAMDAKSLNGTTYAMTVSEAISKATRMKILGWAIIAIATLQLAMFTVFYAYELGESLSKLLPKLGNDLQDLCNIIYQKTSFLLPLWEITPRLDIYNPLNIDTLFLFGIIVLLAMGVYIRGCGNQLSADIAAIRKKARDEIWLRSMLPQDQTTVINQPANVLVLNLPMPPGEVKNWWERPIGLILIGLTTTYIGALITKLAGLT